MPKTEIRVPSGQVPVQAWADIKGAENHNLNVVLHAPTASALQRARNNARNLQKEMPNAEIRIVVNAEAVAAALDTADDGVDGMTWVCPNTLARLGRALREPLKLLPGAAVLELVRIQQAGWVYIRA